MKLYAITIQATITKTIEIMANSEAEAEMTAHDQFTVEPEPDENYDQETIRTELLQVKE